MQVCVMWGARGPPLTDAFAAALIARVPDGDGGAAAQCGGGGHRWGADADRASCRYPPPRSLCREAPDLSGGG